MASYYYIMAQLPALQFGIKSPISYTKFLDLMESCASKKDFELLRNLNLLPPFDLKKTGIRFLDKWADYERALRISLAKVRAEKLNWSFSKDDENRFDIQEALDVKKVAREACAIDDPLKAEDFLTRVRISAVEQLKGFSNFNRDALFAYAITLLLKTRAENFDVETGRSEYKSIYEKILEK